jgi:hypothetical protein
MEPVVYNVDVVESLNAFAGRCVYQLLRAFIMFYLTVIFLMS